VTARKQILNIRLSDDEYRALSRVAIRNGVTLSDLARGRLFGPEYAVDSLRLVIAQLSSIIDSVGEKTPLTNSLV